MQSIIGQDDEISPQNNPEPEQRTSSFESLRDSLVNVTSSDFTSDRQDTAALNGIPSNRDETENLAAGSGIESQELLVPNSSQAYSTGASYLQKGTPIVELKARPFPMPKNKLCSVKIPKSLLQFETQPFNKVQELQKLSDNGSGGPQLETEGVVRWRIGSTFKDREQGEAQDEETWRERQSKPNTVESNASLVQWSDGTWTFAVGDIHYECQLQSDRCFIVETSNPGLYVAQGVTAEKMTLRPFGPATSQLVSGIKGTPTNIKNTTQLTSAADALRSEIANRKLLEAAREQQGSWSRHRLNRLHK